MRETGGARRLEATLCPVTASIGFICPTISPMMLFIVRWVMRQLKRSRSLRLEQIKASLTASMTRPGPADTRNRFPLSTRVLGLARAGILLSVVFCWETWPGLSLGTGRPRESWHLSQWPESRVSGDLRLRHPGQEDNCQESVNRSSYVKLVHNWPGREGRSQEKCWDPAQFKDVTKLCSGVLAPNIQAGRLWIDWI